MKTRYIITIGLLCFSGAAFCATDTEPNEKNMTAALKDYLQKQGDYCLGKFEWPIDVSEAEANLHSSEALQMPVLEKLGLVASSSGEAMRKIDDKELSVPVKRYQLTAEGKKYYIAKQHTTNIGGKPVTFTHDFCAGKLNLNKLLGWDKPFKHDNSIATTVTYTFNMTPASWAKNPDLQKVFPLLAKIVNGGGTMKLKQSFKLEGDKWVPFNPWN